MESSATTLSTSGAEPKKRRGCFSLLFKSALGCTAFAVGSLIALVLLLPTLCGSLVGALIESEFHEKFLGTVEVGSVDLAWSQPQSLRDVVMRTPERSEVLRVSVTLPSLLECLRSGGSTTRKVQVSLNADLVADDAGVTNLERALAPAPSAADSRKKDEPQKSTTIDLSTRLEGLGLEVELTSQRLSWSDSETRRAGVPFEIRDLNASLALHPGQPITARAHGTIASEAPGDLALDATLHDFLSPDQKWPWGRLDMKLSVKGFSSAMLDGVANQHGRLKELLGPRFDFTFEARGTTPEAGDVALVLESEGAKAHLAGRFENAAFHLSSAAGQGLTIPLPRSYIEEFVTPHLPPGSKLVFDADPDTGGASTQLWTLHVDKLELPIPDSAARDLKALQPFLERLACDVLLDLPAGIGFENPSLPPGSGTPTLRRTRLGLHIAPQEPGPSGESKERVIIGLSADLEMNGQATIGAEIKLGDPWPALAAGSLPPADAHLEILDVPTALLDLLAQPGGKVARALGPKVSLRFRAQDVSRDSGAFSMEVGAKHLDMACSGKLEQGRIRCSGTDALILRAEPPRDWLEAEIAARLPPGLEVKVIPGPIKLDVRDVTFVLPTGPGAAGDVLGLLNGALAGQLSCELPALRVSNESTRAAKIPMELGGLRLALNLGLDGQLALALKSTLDTGRKGTLSVMVGVDEVWKLARAEGLKALPPIDAKLTLEGLSTPAIDRLASQEKLVEELLGPTLSLTFEATDATAQSGRLRLDLAAPRLKLAFSGELAPGALRCAGEDGLDLEVSPANEFLMRVLAPYLPAGADLTAPKRPFHLSLREALLPLPESDFAAPLGKSAIAALMEHASGRLRFESDRLVYSDPRTRTAKIAVALDALAVSIDLAPKQPLVAKLDAAIEAGGRGTIEAEASLKDPWLALRTEPAGLPPLAAKLKISGFPSASIDALAGQTEMLAKLFGPAIDLDAAVTAASFDEGSFRLEVKSPSTTLSCNGRLEKNALVSSGAQGLDLSLRLPPGWLEGQVSPLLPAGARLSAPSDATPLVLVVRDMRFELPKAVAADAAETPDDALRARLTWISKLSLRAKLGLPTLIYADTKTDAAGQPVSIRDLSAAVDLVPGKPPQATLRATIEAETPGELNVDLRALDPLEKLADEHGLDTFRVAIDVGAAQVPTALVDALAGQNGLFVDALGPRLQVTLKSAGISREQGSFVAALSSDQHSMHIVEGHFEQGDLVIDKDGGLVAKVGLTPLVSQRLVGNLVPMLVDVQKPPGSEPASFAVDSLRWPKDGDLARLDAVVRVNLGDVSYRLLPGLEAVFGSSLPKSVKLPELRVPIEHGVASYAGLPIKIGGRDFVFKGTFNLKDQNFKLSTDVPLGVLGKNVEQKLESLRGVLSADTLVPIEIRGTWKNPKVSIGSDFLKRALEDAAKKELPGLLDGLLKKKKKD